MTHPHTAGRTESPASVLLARYADVRRRLMNAPKPKSLSMVRRWSWAPAPLPVQPIIDDSIQVKKNEPASWRKIVIEVAQSRGITSADILGKSRRRHIAPARQEAIYRVVTELGMSLPAVGRRFGRDHSTVLYAYRQHRALIDSGLKPKRDMILLGPKANTSLVDQCHEVVVHVAMQFAITPAQIYGTQRRADIHEARKEVYLRLYRDYGLSFTLIGKHVGDRDHSSIIHAIGALVNPKAEAA